MASLAKLMAAVLLLSVVTKAAMADTFAPRGGLIQHAAIIPFMAWVFAPARASATGACSFGSYRMNESLTDRLRAGNGGICLYGLAPPKRASPPRQLEEIAAQQLARLRPLSIDGLIVYDIQDEAARASEPRPFPFLPTLDPDTYAYEHLASLEIQKIVYRCVTRDTPESFIEWLRQQSAATTTRASVLVGAPSRRSEGGLPLSQAYALAREHAPCLLLGGVAIAERHASSANEHERILAKTASGCSFFVTQAVYDVTSTKSLLSDYALAMCGGHSAPMPIILTFSPCGSAKTLSFMKWLGIAFPRWLENDLRFAKDPLEMSLKLCERIFEEIWDYAETKGIPVGVNVESVSIRKDEIDASVELFRRLRRGMRNSER
jgi:5,10-methylenetetrahydrofolate reductase